MDRITLGSLIQFCGIAALVVAVLWSGNVQKALIVGGAAAYVVGRWWKQPKRST